MKRPVHKGGGRPYFGQDFDAHRDLAIVPIESFFAQYGNFIFSGCQQNGTSISSGIVMLDGRLCLFNGATGVGATYNVMQKRTEEMVQYEVGQDVGFEVYTAVAGGTFNLVGAKRFEEMLKPAAAINADKLGGQLPSYYAIASNTMLLYNGYLPAGDCFDPTYWKVLKNGSYFYHVNVDLKNKPEQGYYAIVVVEGTNAEDRRVRWYRQQGNTMYTTSTSQSKVLPWVTFWTSENLVNPATKEWVSTQIPSSLPANGGNADTLGGLGSTNFFRQNIIVDDANSIPAIHCLAIVGKNANNNIPTANYATIYQSLIDNNQAYRVQLCVDILGNMYTRTYQPGSFSAWKSVWTSSSLPNPVTDKSTSWLKLGLSSGWSGNLYYRKDASGNVCIRGSAKLSGKLHHLYSSIVGNLPSNHHPAVSSIYDQPTSIAGLTYRISMQGEFSVLNLTGRDLANIDVSFNMVFAI